MRTRVGSRFSQWPNREKMIVTIGKTPSQVTMQLARASLWLRDPEEMGGGER